MASKNCNQLDDFILAHIILEFSDTINSKDCTPVGDEDLAIFVSEDARSILGERKYDLIQRQLANDNYLYQVWLSLIESKLLDGAF